MQYIAPYGEINRLPGDSICVDLFILKTKKPPINLIANARALREVLASVSCILRVLRAHRSSAFVAVRVSMVGDPAQYRWSSYRHHALGQHDSRLQAHSQYIALGRELETRQEAYRDLFRFELEETAISDLRLALQQGQVVGSEKFKDAMSTASGVRRTQTRRGRPVKLVAELVSKEGQTDFGF